MRMTLPLSSPARRHLPRLVFIVGGGIHNVLFNHCGSVRREVQIERRYVARLVRLSPQPLRPPTAADVAGTGKVGMQCERG